MKEVDIISKVVGRDTSGKAAMYIPGAGAPSVDLDDYLLKKIWDSVFEIRTDSEGNPYLFEKMPFVTQYGITMYADGGELDLPSIYAGLPIDGSTLIRDDNGVLMINPDIDLGGGASTWDELIGKPSWIGSTKPSYNYSEILQTPDLSVYALAKDLEKYVTLNTEQTIAAHKNFLNGLSVGGLGITKSQDDIVYIDANLVVRGGITMYATDTVDVPSIIDSLPTASTSAKGLASFDPNFFSVDVNGNVSFIGSTGITEVNWTDVVGRPTLLSSFINDQGFASTLGELANVGSWADSAPTQGRLLYQAKDSKVWTYKNVSDFVSENGLYLPLTGGVLTGNLEVTSITHSSPYATNIDTFGNLVFGSSGLDWSIKRNDQNKIVTLYNTGKLELNGRMGSDVPLTILSSNNQGLVIKSIATETSINYYAEAYGTSWTTGINIKGELANSYCIYSTTKNENVLKFRGSDGRGFVKFGMEFENTGLTTYASNGITIGSGDAAERYITCYGKNVGYINIGKSPSNGNTGELAFHYYGDGSSNMLQFGFYGGSSSDIRIYYNSHTQVSGNLLTTGGITMYSDLRKKTKLQDVELSLKQIADAPLIEHYYNSDAMRTTHVGSIAQYWAGLNDWFCKKDSEGFYTMEIQNAALASAISIARELSRYETKTDRKIRLLKQRVKELEDKIEQLENN